MPGVATLIRCSSLQVSGRYHRLPKKIEEDYAIDFESVLGTGMNGSVFKARGHGSRTVYAVKGFKLRGIDGEAKEQLVSEAEIFLMMDHPHVARLIAVYESQDMLNLVMECMDGGELFDRVVQKKCYSEGDAAHSMWQMLLAINYLHTQEIVHRDLKLENFLYETRDTDHLKLIDFGFSKVWEPNTKMALSCGTLSYVAPEVLARSYTKQCDLWSLGVVCFILTLGYIPFSGSEDQQITNISKGLFKKKQSWGLLSNTCRDFIVRLLQVDPNSRLTSEQALKHPWIANRDQSGHYRITPLAKLDSRDAMGDNESLNIDESTIDALCQFQQASRFRRACMSLMAWSLTRDERAAVRDAFIELDVKRQGTIKLCELQQVLRDKFGSNDSQIKPLLVSLSSAQTEEIHYSEFLAAMVSTRITMHDEHIVSTFRRFDTDNTGFITHANLREVLGNDFNEEEMLELIRNVDPDNGDKISYENFVRYLKSGKAKDKHSTVALKIIDSCEAVDEEEDGDNDSPSRTITRHEVNRQPAKPQAQDVTSPRSDGMSGLAENRSTSSRSIRSRACALL